MQTSFDPAAPAEAPAFVGDTQSHSGLQEPSPHSHAWAQVSIPLQHALTVMTAQQAILVPPQSAVWMPAGVVHHCRSARALDVRNVALHPGASGPGPCRPCVLRTTPFLRELVSHMTSLEAAQISASDAAHLAEVLLRALRPSEVPPIEVRMPRDRRLQVIARAVLHDALDERSLRDWSQVVGASYRTLARRFVEETSHTFNEWRETVRLVEAARLLAAGHSVGHAAAALGYSSAAGFTAMFRRRLGLTPSDYQRRLDGASPPAGGAGSA
ncbi:MAG: helix-turn-helix transcriptional regulator [Pseudomonadota bacterium]